MKFGCTIIHVPDVAASLAYFTDAFGLPRCFLQAHSSPQPLGVEIGLVTDDVAAAHARAVAAGARELAAPIPKPWGQTVSCVRCPDGTLVELCSPMGADA